MLSVKRIFEPRHGTMMRWRSLCDKDNTAADKAHHVQVKSVKIRASWGCSDVTGVDGTRGHAQGMEKNGWMGRMVPQSVWPKAQLAKAWGTKGPSRYGVKLVVEPLELLRLPEARGEVPLEALEDFLVPEAALGI